MKRLGTSVSDTTKSKKFKKDNDKLISTLVSRIRYRDVEHYLLSKEYLQRELDNVDDVINIIVGPSLYPLYVPLNVITQAGKWWPRSEIVCYNPYKPVGSILTAVSRPGFDPTSRKYNYTSITLGNDLFILVYRSGVCCLCNGSVERVFNCLGALKGDIYVYSLIEDSLKRIVLNDENIILEYKEKI